MLDVHDVCKAFAGRTVLKGVSFKLESAEILGILGGNGVGKTTLLRLIAGLEELDAGTIGWRGKQWAKAGRAIPPWDRPIGTMFQQPTLWPHLSVRTHLEVVLKSVDLSRVARRQRISRWLDALDLESLQKRLPSELSGGQQSRVALARAVVREPELLLLDEPFGPMDSSHQAHAWAMIKEFVERQGGSALVVTQDPIWAAANLNRVFELKH